MWKKPAILIIISFIMITLYGCSKQDDNNFPTKYPSSTSYTMQDLLLDSKPGDTILEDSSVIIDYPNASKGYLCIKRLLDDNTRMVVKLINNDIKLEDPRSFDHYDLNKPNEYESFPLVYGSGTYTINVYYYNDATDKFTLIYHPTIKVSLDSEQTPFLYPNQTVCYDQNSLAIQASFDLCLEDTNDLQRIKTLYDYVVDNITYDDDKVERTKNKYVLPIVDETFTTNKGICFDYAALLAAMCRAQHIPCKVVVGNTKIAYHAWVEVWLNDTGWVNPEVLFDSDAWTRMDPTFVASGANYQDFYETIYEY